MQLLIKRIITSLLATAMLFIAILAQAEPAAVGRADKTDSGIKISTLQKQAVALKGSEQYKRLSPKAVRKSSAAKAQKKLVKKFRRLNRKVIQARSGDKAMASVFVGQYQEIENQIDQFGVDGDTLEGKGACMKECADNFPGTGGGNGANRIACKLSCLILGE